MKDHDEKIIDLEVRRLVKEEQKKINNKAITITAIIVLFLLLFEVI